MKEVKVKAKIVGKVVKGWLFKKPYLCLYFSTLSPHYFDMPIDTWAAYYSFQINDEILVSFVENSDGTLELMMVKK